MLLFDTPFVGDTNADAIGDMRTAKARTMLGRSLNGTGGEVGDPRIVIVIFEKVVESRSSRSRPKRWEVF